MAETQDIPLLDHELAADEFAWIQAVRDEFAAAVVRSGPGIDPKDKLRQVLKSDAGGTYRGSPGRYLGDDEEDEGRR